MVAFECAHDGKAKVACSRLSLDYLNHLVHKQPSAPSDHVHKQAFAPGPEMVDFLLRLAAAEARDAALAKQLLLLPELKVLREFKTKINMLQESCLTDCSSSSDDVSCVSTSSDAMPDAPASSPMATPSATDRNLAAMHLSMAGAKLSVKAARLMRHVKRPKIKRGRRSSCRLTKTALPSAHHPQKPRAAGKARRLAAAARVVHVEQGQPMAPKWQPKRAGGCGDLDVHVTADPLCNALSRVGYRSLGPIASGAFSTILKAKHEESGEEVAVKLFECSRSTSKRDLHMRDRELYALRKVKGGSGSKARTDLDEARTDLCPFVANLLAVHATPTSTVAVLELCRGGSLQRHLYKLRGKPREPCGAVAGMPLAEVTAYGSQLARALAHLHARDVVHRDVKPANILFYGLHHLKLCDFGFARYCASDASSEASRCHTICGTPIHMAPELTRSSTASSKGYTGRPLDVWALGTVLFEMLHNEPAFTASSGPELWVRIRTCAHAAFRAGLPREWRELLGACLTVQPTRRPTAEALAATAALAGDASNMATRDLPGPAFLPTEPLAC
jgi:serine/threonine protein kinase